MSSSSDRVRAQRGSVLIESLIGVAITAIIGAGTAQIAGYMARSQQELRAHNIAISQLRQRLNSSGGALCGATEEISLPNGHGAAMAITCTTPPPVSITPSVTAGGSVPSDTSVAMVRTVSASVSLQALGVHNANGAQLVIGTRQ